MTSSRLVATNHTHTHKRTQTNTHRHTGLHTQTSTNGRTGKSTDHRCVRNTLLLSHNYSECQPKIATHTPWCHVTNNNSAYWSLTLIALSVTVLDIKLTHTYGKEFFLNGMYAVLIRESTVPYWLNTGNDFRHYTCLIPVLKHGHYFDQNML